MRRAGRADAASPAVVAWMIRTFCLLEVVCVEGALGGCARYGFDQGRDGRRLDDRPLVPEAGNVEASPDRRVMTVDLPVVRDYLRRDSRPADRAVPLDHEEPDQPKQAPDQRPPPDHRPPDMFMPPPPDVFTPPG